MSYYIIEGGIPLKGSIHTQGAKNSAVHLIAASLLAKDEVTLENVPAIADVLKMIKILEKIGAKVAFDQQKHSLSIDSRGPVSPHIIDPIASELRASLSFLGALLARERETSILFPGGCNIGSRPVDFHLKGFSALGAETSLEHGLIQTKAARLTGKRIYLDYPSVGATINLTMVATLAKGETIIENVAEEPEIVDFCNFLKKMGAKIKGAGTKRLCIKGVPYLHGTKHRVIPDRIEGGTYLIAGAITGGELTVKEIVPQHLEPLLVKLQEAGAQITQAKDRVSIKAKGRLKAVNIKTMPYPGFPTDLQNQMIPLLALAEGTSVITETVFENRFLSVSELRKMGANIRIEGQSVVIQGVESLTGAKLASPNLRGGASLVLAALAANGSSEVHDIEHVERGYEKMEEKLRGSGAKIRRI
ncbi:MAG: UDP-N-acetylglucosamine 1-carboxyvinyltransferase [Caldiserica bacterium]|jgi:UDP-N-acetylglucosamine 1-carboxyvinyltransferase|nr:UDP-N-acetylglucosamine 1-carboxyvinyltransferase [Caldisericota bacterium]